MIDSKGLIHVPATVRWVALILLFSALIAAMGLTIHYAWKDYPADLKFADWILVGMSLIHLTLSGLAVVLVLFFSERQANAEVLALRTHEFLTESVPQALSRVSASYALRHQPAVIDRLGRSDIFGAAYGLSSGEHQMKLWAGLNVSRLFVIFWLKVPAGTSFQEHSERIKATFAFTFGGAQNVGYHTYYEPATLNDGEDIISVWSSVETEHNLLTEPAKRLFWLQDLAMLTESFWRTALRSSVLVSKSDPSPL